MVEMMIESENHIATWALRRSEIMGRIADLKEKRGAAMVDGVEFDSQPIRDAEDELDAIDLAEATEERRARQKLLAEDEARRKKARADLAKARKTREAAMQQAEDACHALASALRKLLDGSREASNIMMKLGFSQPGWLAEPNVKLSASLRMAAILQPVCGRRFGNLELPEAKADHLADGSWKADSWKVADRKKSGAAFDAALETGEEK